MSQSIGSLVIKLEAQTAALRTDMAEARRIIDTNTSTMQRAFSGVQSAARGAAAAVGAIGAAVGIGAFVSYARQVVDTVGALGEMADQLGVTTDGLQALQFQALQSGASVETLEGGLARFTRSVGDAAEGNDALLDRFKALGVGILDGNGKLRSSEAILGDVAQALAKIEDPAKQAAAVVDLFGKSGQRLLPLLKDLSEVGMDGLIRSAKEAGAVVDEQLIKRFDALGDAAAMSSKRLAVFAAEGIGAVIEEAKKGADAYARFLNSLENPLERKRRTGSFFGNGAEVRPSPSPSGVAPPIAGLDSAGFVARADNAAGFRMARARAADRAAIGGAGNQNPASTRDLQGIIAGDNLVRQLGLTRDSMNATQAAQLKLRLEREMDSRVVGGKIVTERRYSDEVVKTAVAIQSQIDAAQELQTRLQAVYDDAAGRDAANVREIQVFRDLSEARKAYARQLDETAQRQAREIELVGQGRIVWNRWTQQFEIVNRELEIFNRQQEILARNLGMSNEEARAQAEKQVDAAEKLREAQNKQDADLKRQQATYDFVANAGERAFDRVGDAMTQMAVEGGNAFTSLRNVAAGVVASIYADFLKLAIANPLKNLLLGTESPTLGAAGGLFGKMFGQGDQGGGMMSVVGNFGATFGGARARGGRVEPGKAYLVGENGPEPFVPDAAGRIFPTDSAGDAKGDTYYIDARGADQAAIARLERQIASLNGTIEKRALSAFAEDYSRGGQTSKVMRAG
jgi:hypothetical protein